MQKELPATEEDGGGLLTRVVNVVDGTGVLFSVAADRTVTP